ncbi:TniQ protein [Paenibacillus sp. yr247]|uniref:TniQ family protein n=1 Tax=Paenibacillus sp. yr247 TaxID=1761880 RepID=UPI00088D10EE|nr:TniQ family protein [Paenibacillus sp. yr247]SDO30543.1 TniQ protein [Paenibacillus sp. yr247]
MHCYPDESLEGFLCRLALINHREVFELGVGTIKKDASEKQIEKYLDSISVLAGQDITKDYLITYRWFLEGLTLPEWKNQLYSRFCPKCVEQSTYHRANWSLTHHTYCYKHLIYLIENCSYCQKKIKVVDITKGKCGYCNSNLKHSPVLSIGKEPKYLTEEGDFKNIDSPFLQHSLSITEQIILTQWLSYYLVMKTDLFNITLNSTEKQRLASRGYYHDIIQQFKIMSLANDLLSAWPSKLVIFLNIHFKGSFDRTKDFMFKFVYLMRDKNLKNVLRKTHMREESYKNIRFEQMNYDRNYLFVEDIIEIFGIPEELLQRVLNKSQIDIIYHPRNNLKIIHKDYIPMIQIEFSNYDEKIGFISLSKVAIRWNVSNITTKLICEMFQVPTQYLLEEVCYELAFIERLDQKVTEYISAYNLLDNCIWSNKTIKEYLKRKNIEVVFQSSINSWDYLYFRGAVINAINMMSNNKSDYLDRSNVINQLGFELFKAGQLDVYYFSSGSKGSPFYYKLDVQHVINMYEVYKNVKEVAKYRHHEIVRRALYGEK